VEIVLADTEHASESGAAAIETPEPGRRLRHDRDRPRLPVFYRDRQEPGPSLHEQPPREAGTRQQPMLIERHERADGRVPAEINLVARREVPEAQIGLGRRQDEGRFVEADRACDGLHRRPAERLRVEHNAGGIPHAGPRGEGVEVQDAGDQRYLSPATLRASFRPKR